ncbi:MAG: glycosyltransferase [Ornithinibacter sp.]
MRIALLGPSRHPICEPFAGGQESHVATLARALRVRGHHVLLYAAPGSDPRYADELVLHPAVPELSCVAASDINLPEPSFLSDQHAFLFVVADLMRRAGGVDVVHNSSLHHLPLVAGSAVDRPLVVTLHTPPFPWMEIGVSLADPRTTFVAVSDALAAAWTSVPPHRMRVVANGVDVSAFEEGCGGEGLVWVGRMVPEKGADVAILAARASGRALTLVGPLSDREWFAERIAPELGPKVTYAGHLTHRETGLELGRAGVALVTPRWEEPFGLVAVEAALTGTPVVAIGRGGLLGVVDEEMGVLVAPTSDGDHTLSEDLARGIERASVLPRGRVREAARRRFSAEAMATAYEDLYQEAVATW